MNLSLDEWVQHIGHKSVPVQETTINALRQYCAQENASVAELEETVDLDPGLVIHLLRLGNTKTSGSLSTDITTIPQALMILGVEQVNELPQRLPSIEKTLKDDARIRLLKTFARAYHAARQATRWAIQRRDMTPEEVFAATQLHFLGEMFVAMYAPALLDQVDKMRNEKNIAAEEAQFIVLGFTLDQLTAKLARQWKLPDLLLEALHPENAKFPRAYGIMLAVQLARGAAVNWYTEKTCKIQEHAAKWLKTDLSELITGTHILAVEVARESTLYGVPPAVLGLAYIPPTPEEKTEIQERESIDEQQEAEICLMPQIHSLKLLLGILTQKKLATQNSYELISHVLKGLHDGVGLNRVVFARLDTDNKLLKAEKIIGVDNDPLFSRFEIKLAPSNLFNRLLEKSQAVLINDRNRTKFWPLIPEEFKKLIGTNSFVAMSIFVAGKPLGLIYADRRNSACQMDDQAYKYFKTVCKYTSQVLQRLPNLDFSHP
ncbi:Predicted signal transduction protein [hydrothermal vent metagenome]|uniref:Predicted signal transduction protein n=1 Tax=hydrothermal vent metagenome TaxID=652676 RepID=A0A3B1BH10_9ZZZZ